MRYFRVLHDFSAKADEKGELSVKQGDYVQASGQPEDDGWIAVEIVSNKLKKGFVPMSYLTEVSDYEAMSEGAKSASAAAGQLAFSNLAIDMAQSSAKKHYAVQQQDSQGGGLVPHPAHYSPFSGGAGGNTSALSAGGGAARSSSVGIVSNSMLTNPATVVEAFMKNEVYYQQLMKQRQEALQKMESALHEAHEDVMRARERNAHLVRKVKELDHMVEKERRTWRDRVEEERAIVMQKATVQLNVPGYSSPPRSSGTAAAQRHLDNSINRSVRVETTTTSTGNYSTSFKP